MLLQESRRLARTTPTGDLILLTDQDRALWNQGQIAEGRSLVQQGAILRAGGGLRNSGSDRRRPRRSP
ncbi:MAG TPA: DUF6596 domain-containing protein [Nodosilinea sp.]|nr:DUF6596 domain-containing protein [Nodosilinea sp.]